MRTNKAEREAKQGAVQLAIAAIRNAAQVMAAEVDNAGGKCGPCFLTDIAHDERAITEHLGNAFAWAITPDGTHYVNCRQLTDTAAIASWTERQFEVANRACRASIRAVSDTFPGARWYYWDGVKLHDHSFYIEGIVTLLSEDV